MKKETKQKLWHFIITILTSALTSLSTSSCMVNIEPKTPPPQFESATPDIEPTYNY
ncbi:MAG: hypothetical protein MJY78_11640 [Fibrobacter sp.]|nr:hypothetical protein [Fibrobacter sp.]